MFTVNPYGIQIPSSNFKTYGINIHDNYLTVTIGSVPKYPIIPYSRFRDSETR